MDTGLIVTKGKIELKTDGMLKKIQGRMTVKINDQCFENIGVLWDTGCTDSGIDTSLLEKLLNLEKDWSTISTASGHTNTEYVVTSIEIAGIKLEGIRLVKTSNLKQTQGLDMLIGMDVIQNGRMVIQCSESEKSFEFIFNQ